MRGSDRIPGEPGGCRTRDYLLCDGQPDPSIGDRRPDSLLGDDGWACRMEGLGFKIEGVKSPQVRRRNTRFQPGGGAARGAARVTGREERGGRIGTSGGGELGMEAHGLGGWMGPAMKGGGASEP